MPIPRARRMNLVALALLITALIAFIAFHFLPWFEERDSYDQGWKLWPWVIQAIASFKMNEDLVASLALSTSAAMLLAGPFTIGVLRSSRLIWWLALVVAASAGGSLTGILVSSVFENQGVISPGAGMLCLLAAQGLLLSGLLFIRREPPAVPAVDRA